MLNKYKKLLYTVRHEHRETIINFLLRLIQVIGRDGVNVAVLVIATNNLSVFDFGNYVYALAVIYVLVLFSDFGISASLSKFVAEYSAKKDRKFESVLVSISVTLLSVSSVIFLVIFAIGQTGFFDEFYGLVLPVLPLIFLVPLSSVADGFFRGMKKFKYITIVTSLAGAVLVPLAYYLIKAYGLWGAFMAQDIYYFLLVVGFFLGSRKYWSRFNRNVVKDVLGYAVYIGVANVGYFLYIKTDIIILGHYGFMEAAGYYEIASKVMMVILLPVLLLATVVAPNSTKKFSQRKYQMLRAKIIKESKILFIIGIVVAVCAYFGIKFGAGMIFKNHESAFLITIISILLIIIPLRYFSTYITIAYITPFGKAKILSVVMITFGVLNVVLNILFIKWFGVIGVIFATMISQLGYILVKDVVFYRYLQRLVNFR